MNPLKLTFAAALACFAAATMNASAMAGVTPAQEAFTLRMDGKSDEAKLLLLDSLAEDDSDAAAWFELARTEFYHFEFDAAADAIDKAIELVPDNAHYRYLAGVTAGYNAVLKAKSPETRNQIEPLMGESIAAFQKAVELDPEHHDARIMLINMLLETPEKQGGDKSEAKRQVEKLESLDEIRGLEGRLITNDVSDEKEVSLWKKMVATHHASADAHAGLARAYLKASELEKAEEQINEVIRLDPGRESLLIAYYRECAMNKANERAQKGVLRYLDTDPIAPMRSYATFCLAVLNKKQGNRDKAEALLAEAKQIDPHCWTTFMEPPAVLFDKP